jgi:hypothetical protein
MENDQTINKQVLALIVPAEILESFQLIGVFESKEVIELQLHERKDLIPASLQGMDVVLDGFCNPIELQSFPLQGKATFIKLFRRRWKQRGTSDHRSNTYDFTAPGTKATRMFGAFLKGAFGLSPDSFQHARHRAMHPRK